MKQEIPKPILAAIAVVGLIIVAALAMKLMSAGEVQVDPKLDQAAAESAAQRMNNYSSDAPAAPGSERAARGGQ